MVWATFTGVEMDAIAVQLFKPMILLVNYTLLQYLMVFYWARRREPRVVLLFAVGLLGVLCLIPFANADDALTGGLNDVSESSCVLTFLIQITIIGRDLNKKIKFKTVLYLTWAAELLILVDMLMILFSLVIVAWPDLLSESNESLKDDLPNVFENINLAFIVFFRFFYIIQSRGFREITKKRKLEITWYLLFMTHEAPFLILEHASGLSWESVQAAWHRLTLAGCLYVTATGKLRDRATTVASQADSYSSPPKVYSRSSAGRFKRASTTRRGSNNVYAVATRHCQSGHAVATLAVASARTASIDRTSAVTALTVRKDHHECE